MVDVSTFNCPTNLRNQLLENIKTKSTGKITLVHQVPHKPYMFDNDNDIKVYKIAANGVRKHRR